MLNSLKNARGGLPVLYNRSFISYNYKDITYYDKSSYYNESQDAIFGLGSYTGTSHVYMIGDGKDHRIGTIEYPLLEDLLVQHISSEVCYDLLVWVSKANGWKNEANSTKLYILSSNSVDAKGNEKFPNNKLIVCVDPDSTLFTKGASLSEVFYKKDSKLEVSQKDVTRFYYGDRIKGNRYHITASCVKMQ